VSPTVLSPVANADHPAIQSPVPVNSELLSQARNKAAAAKTIAASAVSAADWSLAMQNVQEAIATIESMSPQDVDYSAAREALPEMRALLDKARGKAQQPAVSQQVANNPASNPARENATPQPEIDDRRFEVPIVGKVGGIPIVEVTFNGSDRIAMLMDTGASSTMLPSAIADRLNLSYLRTEVPIHTAGGTTNFRVAKLKTIAIGKIERTNIPIAVGNNGLPYGLLGHDIYDGYDITFRSDKIVFERR
jgi:aspartyl protease family protein